MPLLFRCGFWLWLAFITIGSLLPAQQLPATDVSDKHSHFLAYGLLTLLALGAWVRQPTWRVLLGVIAYGIVIELLQSLTPTRQLEGLDILANTLGAGLGALLFQWLPVPGKIRS